MPDSPTPTHLGLILDGNRRWAKENGVSKIEGHKRGYGVLKDVTKAAMDRGVKYVSAFAFSTENWSRASDEVRALMDLAYHVIAYDIRDLNKENIKVVWLGSRKNVSDKLLKAIQKAEESTKNNTRGTLAICFNYGGQEEILDATRSLMSRGYNADDVTAELFESALYVPEVPPVDFLIRTSGEQRVSGFMLWRLAYAEFYFLEKYWPDFSVNDLDEALRVFAQRQRRIGS